MICRELQLKLASGLSSGDNLLENLRRNLFHYIDDPGITIQAISRAANISQSTLNGILYGNNKDCHLGTVAALAGVLGVSIDELVGAKTLSEDERTGLQIMRSLPEHSRHTLLWLMQHHRTGLFSSPTAVWIPKPQEGDPDV